MLTQKTVFDKDVIVPGDGLLVRNFQSDSVWKLYIVETVYDTMVHTIYVCEHKGQRESETFTIKDVEHPHMVIVHLNSEMLADLVHGKREVDDVWTPEMVERVRRIVAERGHLTLDERKQVSKDAGKSLRAVANLEYGIRMEQGR